jgi:hypothetical protein
MKPTMRPVTATRRLDKVVAAAAVRGQQFVRVPDSGAAYLDLVVEPRV